MASCQVEDDGLRFVGISWDSVEDAVPVDAWAKVFWPTQAGRDEATSQVIIEIDGKPFVDTLARGEGRLQAIQLAMTLAHKFVFVPNDPENRRRP